MHSVLAKPVAGVLFHVQQFTISLKLFTSCHKGLLESIAPCLGQQPLGWPKQTACHPILNCTLYIVDNYNDKMKFK